MPCYTQRTVTLELKAADNDVLLRGLEAAGYRQVMTKDGVLTAIKGGIRIRIAGGKIEVTGSSTTDTQAERAVNEVKRAYATQAVQEASRRFGWTYKATGENAATLARRF